MAKKKGTPENNSGDGTPGTSADGLSTCEPIAVHCAHDELVEIGKLIPHPKNPNRHPEAQIRILAKAIRHHGWRAPIVVSKRSGFIVSGHGRLEAARLLGLKTVPVNRQDFATEADELAHLLADNRIAELAEMNEDETASLLQFLKSEGSEIEWSGFTSEDLGDLLEKLNAKDNRNLDAEPQIEKADELNRQWDVKLGEIWKIGKHRLLCGDSTDGLMVSRLLNGTSPQLMVTDPPYGVKYDASWRIKAKLSKGAATGRVLNDETYDWRDAWKLFCGNVVYVWHAGVHAAAVQASIEAAGFGIRSQIIWVKSSLVLGRGDYYYQHEPCWYAVRTGMPSKFKGGRKQTTVWEIDKPIKSDSGHSTQKPLECMARPIRNHSGSVYDPFAGSGTTLVASENLGRSCFAIELHPPYCAVILDRMSRAFPGITITRE